MSAQTTVQTVSGVRHNCSVRYFYSFHFFYSDGIHVIGNYWTCRGQGMDGLFLSDEDIIGTNSDAFKSFNLDDEWGVSPGTTQFSLRSPELNFTAQNFLEKVHIVSEDGADSTAVKQEIKEERSSPVHWFSVLENKQIWKDNARNSFEERYLRAEQVVPDQVHVMELANQKSNPLQTCNDDPCKLGLTDSASSSTTDMIDNSLQNTVISENPNAQIFTSNNKEQVNGYQHIVYRQAPADDLFTFTLCDNQCFEQVVKQELQQEISDSDKLFNVDENLSNVPRKAVDVLGETPEQLYANGQLENESSFLPSNGPSDSSPGGTKDVIDDTFEDKHCVDGTGETKESLKIRQKIVKFLTPKKIPKCTMVFYSFNSSEKLPCFADVFGPLISKEPDLALPKVLECEGKNKKEEEEDDDCIFFSDDDSECNSVEAKQESLHEPCVKNEMKPDDCLLQMDVQPAKIEMAAENADELSSRFNNKTPINEVDCMDTSPNMLTLDDELESFLVSNMAITDDQCGENSQLLDLSENLGCILRNDNLHEETPLESVYRNLFSRGGVGIPGEDSNWSRQQRPADENGYGNFLNAALMCSGAERGCQFSDSLKQQHINRGNMNAIYGNIWARNATNGTHLSQMGGRHLPNDRIFNATDAESYTHGIRKNILNLPPNVIRTDNDNFEFGSTAARVEVVDSSMNYNF